MAAIYEMIRQGRRHMTMAAKTAVHDIDVLIGGGTVDRVECAYAFGHELRGLSPTGRRPACLRTAAPTRSSASSG